MAGCRPVFMRLRDMHKTHVARETVCTMLYVFTSLCIFAACHDPSIRSTLSISAAYSPNSVFLAVLAGFLAVWDYFDLAFGSLLNPAISIAHVVAGRLPWSVAPWVVLGQFIGHVAAVRAVQALVGQRFLAAFGILDAPAPLRFMRFLPAVLFEACMTGVLACATIVGEAVLPGELARGAVMLALVIGIIATGQSFTGSVLNPAMAMSLAVFDSDGNWTRLDQLVYWCGPISGALIAALVSRKWHPPGRNRVEKHLSGAENVDGTERTSQGKAVSDAADARDSRQKAD